MSSLQTRVVVEGGVRSEVNGDNEKTLLLLAVIFRTDGRYSETDVKGNSKNGLFNFVLQVTRCIKNTNGKYFKHQKS